MALFDHFVISGSIFPYSAIHNVVELLSLLTHVAQSMAPVFSGLMLKFKSPILTWRMVLYTFRELYETIRKDEHIVIYCRAGYGRLIFSLGVEPCHDNPW